MSFYSVRNPVGFQYLIGGDAIEFRDLGVVFTENMSFNRHVDVVVAYSILGFVKRMCRDFRNLEALTSVFFAHVRSHLEYALTAWSHCHSFTSVTLTGSSPLRKLSDLLEEDR